MKNLISKIDAKIVKDYGITEAFYIDGELYITSNYELSYDLIKDIENHLDKAIISDVLDNLFSKESKESKDSKENKESAKSVML